MGHAIGVSNRKGSLNVQSGLLNLGLVALHRSLVVQNDMLHLCARGPLSVFDRLSVDTVACVKQVSSFSSSDAQRHPSAHGHPPRAARRPPTPTPPTAHCQPATLPLTCPQTASRLPTAFRPRAAPREANAQVHVGVWGVVFWTEASIGAVVFGLNSLEHGRIK